MRKFFTTLKSVVATAIIASMTLAASCSYDDGAINERVDKVEGDLAALTERVAALEKKLNDEVAALKAVLDGNAVVTEVTTDEDGNTTIKLSDGKTITVLTGLQYRVVDGVLELSADGENWVAVSVAPECVVAEVVVNDDNTVTIKLANDEEFTVVKAELIEFGTTRSSLYVLPDETKEITVTINDAVADINVMNQPLGWKAEIALKPAVEEPEEGAGDNESEDTVAPMPLAAGGTEYVLSITGPAQEFVNAGFAEKEGYITVHFNTESGACKVGKVLVSLAEITLSVSADGMIHIENSVVEEVQQGGGGPLSSDSDVVYDFADFYIGVIPAEVYAQYGDKSFTDNFDDMYYEYFGNVAATKRTTGLGNVVDLQQYEEGVTEKEVYDLSVETLAGAFWPVYEFEYGKEYIIFVSLEGEMVNHYEHPVLKGAVMDTYKKVLVEAEYVADSATWNDASYKLSLAGFTCYAIGWFSEAEINQYLEQGVAETVEELIPMLLQYDRGLMSRTAIVADTFLNETVTLSSLADRTLTYVPPIDPNTKYYFFVYPFNAANELELYTHEVVAENVHLFGTFETAALTKGEFDPGITYEVVTMTENSLNVSAYFGENVVAYYYKYYDSPAEVEDDRALEIMAYEYIQDFSIYEYCEAYQHQPTYPAYLCIVAINAAGKYVYVEEKFEPVPLPEVAVESWEYLGRYWEVINPTDGKSGGEFVYSVKCADGNEYTLNLYYAYCNEDGSIIEGTYEYCTNEPDQMYSSWAGFAIISETEYSGSKLVVAADKITLTVAGVADYVYVPGSEPEQPEEPEQPVEADYNVAFTAAAKNPEEMTEYYCDSFYTFEFTNEDGHWMNLAVVTSALEDGALPVGEFEISVNGESGIYGNGTKICKELFEGASYDLYITAGNVVISKEGDVYNVVVNAKDLWVNGGNKTLKATFEGTITADNGGDDSGDEPEEPAAAFVPVRAEMDLYSLLYEYNGGDSEYAFNLYDEAGACLHVMCQFGNHTDWDYVYTAKFTKADGTVVSGHTKLNTQAPSNYNCEDGEKYYVVDVAFSDGTAIFVQDQIATTEVDIF